MNILVVGLGSIGRRHIKNLKAVDPSLRVALLRQHSKSADVGDVKELLEGVFFDVQKAMAWKPQVVVIANPAPMHVPTALEFARAGAHLFIEKPLSTTLNDIDQLQKICQDRKLTAMVGYVLRFSPSLQAVNRVVQEGSIGKIYSIQASVGRYLPQWRPGDHTKNVSARRDLGGGVVLELSHEIDYVCWLAGEASQVNAMTGRLADVTVDTEDLAHIHLGHKSGVLSQIHLDMLDRAGHRGCRIVGSLGTIVWDSEGTRHSVRLFSAESGQWQVLFETDDLDVNAIHQAQWKHFFECVNTGTQPMVDLIQAKRVLEIALEVCR